MAYVGGDFQGCKKDSQRGNIAILKSLVVSWLLRSTMVKLEKIAMQVRFLLCGSCYWCASSVVDRSIEKCPACSGRLGSVSLAAPLA
jgi:hypothetical protein